MPILFLLLVTIPVVELLILFQVSALIGGWETFVLVLGTAFIGYTLLRKQGLSTLTKAHEKINSGQLPAQEIIEGLMLAVAAVLLLTPGFVSDTVGFMMLLPFARKKLSSRVIQSQWQNRSGTGSFDYRFTQTSTRAHPRQASNEVFPSKNEHISEAQIIEEITFTHDDDKPKTP